MKIFKDKVIVITGAGSGIGRALAQKFQSLGTKLALNDYNEKTLSETIELLALPSHQVYYATVDVSDREAMFNFADDVMNHFSAVDVVVNNAGLSIGGVDFVNVDLDKFERVIDVNFKGVLYGSRAFLPYLEQRPEAALVNISSVYGFTGISMLEAYVSSKFAVNGLTQALIHTYRNTPLRIHSVHPGGIKTNITRNALDYQEKDELFDKLLTLSPAYAAEVIIKGIKKKKSRILIGKEAYLLDFLTRLAPIRGAALVNKYMDPLRKAYKNYRDDKASI